MKTYAWASQAKVAELRKLTRKKYRQSSGKMLIEGQRSILQTIEHGMVTIEAVFVAEGEEFFLKKKHTKVPVFQIPKELYEEVSDTVQGQGCVAIAVSPPFVSENELLKHEHIVALDAVQDPGNLGTLYRTAVWFGMQALLLGKGTVEVYQPKVVRSTAGSTGCLPVCTSDLKDMLPKLREAGYYIYFLDASDGAIPIRCIRPSGKWVLVLGNEGNGIQDALVTSADTRILIEGHSDKVESLNVAVAGAIAMIHFSG